MGLAPPIMIMKWTSSPSARRPAIISATSAASADAKYGICTHEGLTSEVSQTNRIAATGASTPAASRGNLPRSSGTRPPTNLMWVGTTPSWTDDFRENDALIRAFNRQNPRGGSFISTKFPALQRARLRGKTVLRASPFRRQGRPRRPQIRRGRASCFSGISKCSRVE